MKNCLRLATALLTAGLAGTAAAAATCTADTARMKRLEDRQPAVTAAVSPSTSGLSLAVAKRLDGPGAAMPSSSPTVGLDLAKAKRLDRMPAPGRARDIAGSCL